MSKKKKEISLDQFLKMSEAEQQALPSEQYMQLLSEKKEHEKHQADLKEMEQIKAKYYEKIGGRPIFLIEVDGARAWLKSIDRKLMSMISGETDKIEQLEMLLENLWLEGDNRLKNDDDFFFGAIAQLRQIMQVKAGYLKKF